MVQLDPTQYLPLWLFDFEALEDETLEASVTGICYVDPALFVPDAREHEGTHW